MHTVVTEAPAPLVVLIRLVVSGDIIMTREGVTVAAARPAVHGLELVARPERFVVVERRTTLALSGTKRRRKSDRLMGNSEGMWWVQATNDPSLWPEVPSSMWLGPECF